MKRLKFVLLTFLFISFFSLVSTASFSGADLVQNQNVSNVLVGDSITAAWPWQNLLAKKDIVNRGVSGDTSALILQRMDGILSVRPKKAFLMFGINDFGRGADTEQVFNNYKKIIEILQNAKIKVIVSSTIKCSTNQFYLQPQVINKKVDALNVKLKDFCQKNGITFVDINERLSDPNGGLNEKYTVDGVHLNYAAYQEWAKLLSPLINSN
ncbi:hypothetical protein HRQ65_01095 [Tatlockia micdadei]|uniref:Lysophospholipase L1 n=2 Tax=Legionella micdadei TaxID=451 RepID=A0A098GF12_LEGMI|nr:GDSL-type esterase/lipase family protein [Legionella micdadei]KTD28347.1 multifunctional acyl-CoA thioesterase I and protease I and lysophospholipase L1 [Legionella micdadei]NSL16975.1 hypothetical protein [Legionella micdadei]CEG61063.1 exported protein of unknown function [Legionella micdadei]SCY29093.1 Lysophospholipase L1 [Legionella micdadei]